MYLFYKKELPMVFNSIFIKNNEIHQYPTRQTNLLHIPRIRTALTQSTFIYTGPKLWNSLSSDIRETISLSTFKYKLKKKFIASYSH